MKTLIVSLILAAAVSACSPSAVVPPTHGTQYYFNCTVPTKCGGFH